MKVLAVLSILVLGSFAHANGSLDDLLGGQTVHVKGIGDIRTCGAANCELVTRVGYGENLIVLRVDGAYAKVLIEGTNQVGFIEVSDISPRQAE
jgi:hypothetical protein